MPQDSTSASASRFASDLRRIREERGVSIEDLHDETKIPLGLLEAFERTALFDHPQFNRVYLRSFVRTYAQVVRISAERAISALEQALDDEYNGALASEYLGEEGAAVELQEGPASPAPDEKAVESAKPLDGGKAQGSPPPAKEPAGGKAKGPPPPAKEPAGGKAKSSPPPAKEPEEAGEKAGKEADAEGKKAEKADERPRAFVSTTSVVAEAAESSGAEEDWTAQSPPSGRTSGAATRRRPSDRDSGGLRLWGYIAAAVILFGLIIWLVTRFVGGSGQDEMRAGAAADTAAVDSPAVAQPATPRPDRTVPALGDTITFHVVAAEGKLDPIRVTVDSDLRRPYWLEQGDSLQFDATQRIIIEERLENARLTLEGIDYPIERTDERGRVVVTRDSAAAYLDRLR